MDLKIKTLEWAEVDTAELADLALAARKASPLWTTGQDRQGFEQYIHQSRERWPESRILAAYQDGTLVGWLGLILEDPLLFEIWRWQPFIIPGIDPEPAALALLWAAVDIAHKKGAQSLEIACGFRNEQLTPQTEEYYRRQLGWYQACGLQKMDENAYLTCRAEDLKLSPLPNLSGEMRIRSYQPGDRTALAVIYNAAFSAGQDRSYLEKTEAQRKATFAGYFTDELNTAASAVLVEGEVIRGFSLVQSRARVGDEHLALVAVSPEFQNQGWGRALLTASIQRSIDQGAGLFSIGVDLVNQAAYHLYLSLGFKVQSKIINHVWKRDAGS